MSLYKEQEQLCRVYHPTDSNTTKVSTYPATASFSIYMNIIRRNEDTLAVMGQDIGEYVANVSASYANADSIKMSDKIVCGSDSYIVVNKPKYVKLFDKYKLILNMA